MWYRFITKSTTPVPIHFCVLTADGDEPTAEDSYDQAVCAQRVSSLNQMYLLYCCGVAGQYTGYAS